MKEKRTELFALHLAAIALFALPSCDGEHDGVCGDGCGGGCDGCSEADGGADCDGDADAGLDAAEPTPLTTFDAVMEALTTGHEVRAVLRYGNCTLDGAPGPDAIGGMTVDTYEYFAEGVVGNATAYVLFSETSFISVGPDYVYDYVKVRVYEDLEVEVIAQYLDPLTFEVTMSEAFDCPFDTGDAEAPGLSLFSR